MAVLELLTMHLAWPALAEVASFTALYLLCVLALKHGNVIYKQVEQHKVTAKHKT